MPFGRYRLVELRGRGGMGEVWRAYDTRTDREVAIKVLPAHFAADQVFLERFRREAHAAARLRNPHVIPIHDYGETDGRLYVDMRLVDGRDLQGVLAEGPLKPARAVRIIEQVAKALHAAHRVGLVHRDVKPSNVLLDEDDYAYLIDFGIARAFDETRLTGTGNAIGTFQYMAPERLSDNANDDARADIYALSCVLYECLTGKPPFAGTSMASLVAAHLNNPPPQPSTTHPQVPAKFDTVIAIGMAKDPTQRYATAVELATAANDAVTAPIPTAPATQVPTTPRTPRTRPDPSSPRPATLPDGTALQTAPSPIHGPPDEPVRTSARTEALNIPGNKSPRPAGNRWKTHVCATFLILAALFGGAAFFSIIQQYGSPDTMYRWYLAPYASDDKFPWKSSGDIGVDKAAEYIDILFGLSWLAAAVAFWLHRILDGGLTGIVRLVPHLLGVCAAALSAMQLFRPVWAYAGRYGESPSRSSVGSYSLLNWMYFLFLFAICVGLVIFCVRLRKNAIKRPALAIGLVGAAGTGLSLSYLYGLLTARSHTPFADNLPGNLGYDPAYLYGLLNEKNRANGLAGAVKASLIAMPIWLVALLVSGATVAMWASHRPTPARTDSPRADHKGPVGEHTVQR